MAACSACNTRGWSYATLDGEPGRIHFHARIEASNGGYLRDCMLVDPGIAMLPTFLVHEQVRSGQLVALMTDYRWLSAGLYALYPRARICHNGFVRCSTFW